MTRIGAEDLRRLIETFVSDYPARNNVRNWWREPLLVTARADERFEILRRAVDEDHLMPRDILPSARSIIVFFLPFAKELAEENFGGKFPCRDWGLAYHQTNELIKNVNLHLSAFIKERGHESAVTPPTANFDPVRLVSRWSHRHLGYLAGLGRFGMNRQLITPSGCTGRLGSLVTQADLGDNPLTSEDEHCLHKRGFQCLECQARCPIQALTGDGFDRAGCYERLLTVQKHPGLAGLPPRTEVCGKCQVMLPCGFEAPEQP